MKINRLLYIACLSAILFSCKFDIEPKGELISVKLNPAYIGMSQETDVQMLTKRNAKAASDPNLVIYAVQVYENDAEYFYGLFDNVDSIKIALTTGKNYRFKIACYKTGTGNGLYQETTTEGKYFFLPDYVLLTNKFIRGGALKDIHLITSAILATYIVRDYPEIDAFYCDKTVSVQKGLANIDFECLRMGFGITYTVDNISNGRLNVIMGNDTTVLNGLNKTNTSIRQFNASTSDFSTIYNNATTYADSILIKVQWIGSNGTNLSTQGKFKFTRNYLKTINIQLNTSTLSLNFEGWANAVADIDGNTYQTITIGTQTWMLENLKTTHYRDGTAIPNVTLTSAWTGLTTGAYCDMNNNPGISNTNGRLYNWYAISDVRNIAPAGWHVPTDADWTTLTTYVSTHLGTSASVAKALATTTGWNNFNMTGSIGNNPATNNSSGFSALPSGNRDSQGTFSQQIGSFCDFASSTTNGSTFWDRYLSFNSNTVARNSSGFNGGYSVRCVKD